MFKRNSSLLTAKTQLIRSPIAFVSALSLPVNANPIVRMKTSDSAQTGQPGRNKTPKANAKLSSRRNKSECCPRTSGRFDDKRAPARLDISSRSIGCATPPAKIAEVLPKYQCSLPSVKCLHIRSSRWHANEKWQSPIFPKLMKLTILYLTSWKDRPCQRSLL